MVQTVPGSHSAALAVLPLLLEAHPQLVPAGVDLEPAQVPPPQNLLLRGLFTGNIVQDTEQVPDAHLPRVAGVPV